MRSLITVFFLTLSVVIAAQDSSGGDWDTLGRDGYSIGYPKTWALSEDMAGIEFILQSPIESPTDRFSESLNLVVQDFSTMGQEVPTKMVAEMYEVQMKNLVDSYQQLAFGQISFQGLEAWELVSTGSQESFTMKWRNLVFVKDNKGYVFTFTASTDGYDRLLPIANAIIESLKFAD